MNGCRLLLIDDDELSREILELMLYEAGYAVETASSGEEAVAMLTAGESAEIVLADLRMPGLSGAMLAAGIRKLVPAGLRAVLAMSGSEPRPGALEGYDAFLLKPFTMEQLTAAVEDPATKGDVAGEDFTQDAASAVDADAAIAVLDETKLKQLRVSFQPAQIEELFCFALSDAERQLETMRHAAAEGDDERYRRCAHSLKGSFGMLGAPELRELAAGAEQASSNKVANEVTTFVLFQGALARLRHTLISRGICHC